MGAVAISGEIYKALMTGPENTIEFLHGYTYSGHPVASAAGLAVLGIAKKDGLFERGAELAPYFEEAVHSLKGEKRRYPELWPRRRCGTGPT